MGNVDGAKIQAYAVSIEQQLRAEYGCDRYGIGGIANSDHIRNISGAFYHCMAMVLIKYYYGKNKKPIDDFLSNNSDIDGEIMDEIELIKVKKIIEKYDELYGDLRK